MKCGFCKKENTDNISITDGETQQEILICAECDELMFFKVPKINQELTIQALDNMIDNEIEELQLKRKGIEI